jgi:hypothetical protein
MIKVENKVEPPSCTNSESPHFLIGKDSHGCWVVQDESCIRGGLFIDRAEALKFAMFENGHRRALAASGNAATPPRAVMNSRRLIMEVAPTSFDGDPTTP